MPVTTSPPWYDPLLAKLIVHAADRDSVLGLAREAVDRFVVEGPKVNLPFFRELLDTEEFTSGGYDTRVIERMRTGGTAAD